MTEQNLIQKSENMQIFIVEDDSGLRNSLKTHYEQEYSKVHVAASAIEMLVKIEKIDNSIPTIFIMSYRLSSDSSKRSKCNCRDLVLELYCRNLYGEYLIIIDRNDRDLANIESTMMEQKRDHLFSGLIYKPISFDLITKKIRDIEDILLDRR